MNNVVRCNQSVDDSLDFKSLYIIEPAISPDLCQLKPLKLVYTPKLPKIVHKTCETKQLLPHKEVLLQLENLRKKTNNLKNA